MAVTWPALIDLLTYEFSRLRKLPVISFGFASQPVTDPNELKLEELRYAERVDSLVKDFSRTRRWPALDEKEKYFLRERMRFAYEYCSIASLGACCPEVLASRGHVVRVERRLLEWVLIDVWRSSGVAVWLDPLYIMSSLGNLAEPGWEHQAAE
jgi:hypothetical protein